MTIVGGVREEESVQWKAKSKADSNGCFAGFTVQLRVEITGVTEHRTILLSAAPQADLV